METMTPVTGRTCSLITALLLAQGHIVSAQAHPERQGVWADLAIGEGWVHVSSDTLRGRSQSGIDGILAFGWTPCSRVRFGVSWAQWSSRWGGGKQNWITRYDILVYYYPFARNNFFVEAAAGPNDYSVVHVSGEQADTIYLSGHTWGPTIAAGWDAPGGPFSLRPRLTYSYGPPRNLHSGGTLLATGWKQHLLSLDIGVVLHAPDKQ